MTTRKRLQCYKLLPISVIEFILFLFMILSANFLFAQKEQSRNAAKRMNIILLLADDLGYSDLSCYGNKFIETPHLDQLAKQGIKFTQAYAAAPLCSPTRASIISGNNPARINLTEHLHGYSAAGPQQKLETPRIVTGLPLELPTLPQELKKQGYKTAHFGKWHLGSGPHAPSARGFDYAFGGGAEGLPKSFFYPFFHGNPYPDLLSKSKEGDYLDDVLTKETIAFIEKNIKNPFFLELNFYSPHVPIEGKKELVEKYKKKREVTDYRGLPENEYAAMVESIDQNVGQLLEYLEKQGLRENTLIIFMSDNGGLHVREVDAFARYTPPTTNFPLSDGKGYLKEGGIKIPFLVAMPNGKNGINARHILSTDDIFNTCMEIAGSKYRSPDGTSFLDLVSNRKSQTTKGKFNQYKLHFPHYSPQRGYPGAVFRKKQWKLIEWYETGEIELFNLKKDVGEKRNMASSKSKKVKKMSTELEAWRKKLAVKRTIDNPRFQGKK